jgi:hypothetical protein
VHTEELHDVYSSTNIVQMIKSGRMRWAGHVTYEGKRTVAYTGLVGKPEEKRSLGRLKNRWQDNIKIDPQEIE